MPDILLSSECSRDSALTWSRNMMTKIVANRNYIVEVETLYGQWLCTVSSNRHYHNRNSLRKIKFPVQYILNVSN